MGEILEAQAFFRFRLPPYTIGASTVVLLRNGACLGSMAQTLFDAGFKVQIIEDGGENPASVLNEVNEEMAGKVFVVPEPYSRHFLDLLHVPLVVEAFREPVVQG